MRLGPVMRKWRINSELTTREVAKRIGISAGTLCRFERQTTGIDGDTLAKILRWLLEKGEEVAR